LIPQLLGSDLRDGRVIQHLAIAKQVSGQHHQQGRLPLSDGAATLGSTDLLESDLFQTAVKRVVVDQCDLGLALEKGSRVDAYR
jgi:hypothetical protein